MTNNMQIVTPIFGGGGGGGGGMNDVDENRGPWYHFSYSSAITDKVKQNENTFIDVFNRTQDRSVRIKRVSNNSIPKK